MANGIKIDKKMGLDSPQYYFNRELSFIEFNKRVLLEAENSFHPLLERLKFLSIVSSNLDEFFMIRVAGLKNQILAGIVELSKDGMTPEEQLKEIRNGIIPLLEHQERILFNEIMPELGKESIFIHFYHELDDGNKEYLKKYFCENVLPILTPLTLDPAHPFPRLINRNLNIAFVLTDKNKKDGDFRIAFVQLPTFLNRFVPVQMEGGHHFVLIEQIIKAQAEILFPGLTIERSHTFRVTRDADIEIAEDEAEDLLKEIAEQIKHRKWGTAAVRLEVSSKMPQYLIDLLMNSLELEPFDVYIVNRPLNLPDFIQLTKIEERHLKDIPFQTRSLPEFEEENVFDAIAKKDLMIHLPFDSFTYCVLKFINNAADDPSVLAIKITLYRVGLNSPVVAALMRAAENGKEVIAFVELKARFDEENNIIWAKELEQVGAHVIYGVIGLKTHCKIAMVVRKETDHLKTYLHLATGNYNHVTARLYTDIGLFTAHPGIAKEAIHFFNYLTGYSYQKEWNHFLVAPINLRKKLIAKINAIAERHTPEQPGVIFAKMNSITHDEVIQTLYKASQKGVQIKLLIRGICCLKPGIPEISENIEVRSIIGRFLEHSRVFLFMNGSDKEFYLSSADWMTRNLNRRVELMFPVYEPKLQKKLEDLLNTYWQDNKKSWRMLPDGFYEKVQPGPDEELFSAQEYYLEEIKKAKKKARHKLMPKNKNQ